MDIVVLALNRPHRTASTACLSILNSAFVHLSPLPLFCVVDVRADSSRHSQYVCLLVESSSLAAIIMTDEERDEKLKEVTFAVSTHRLFFMKEVKLPTGESHAVNPHDKILSFFVIAFQYACYGVLFHLIRHIPQQDYEQGWVREDPLSNVVSESKNAHVVSLVSSFLLLECFLLPNMAAAWSLVRCGWASGCNYAIVIGILVYLEACWALAVATACSFAWLRGDRGLKSLDMFLFVVGVVFVHDVDEKMYLTWMTRIQTEKRYGNLCKCTFWVVWFIMFMSFWWILFLSLGIGTKLTDGSTVVEFFFDER